MRILRYFFQRFDPKKPTTWHFAVLKTKSLGRITVPLN